MAINIKFDLDKSIKDRINNLFKNEKIDLNHYFPNKEEINAELKESYLIYKFNKEQEAKTAKEVEKQKLKEVKEALKQAKQLEKEELERAKEKHTEELKLLKEKLQVEKEFNESQRRGKTSLEVGEGKLLDAKSTVKAKEINKLIEKIEAIRKKLIQRRCK